MAHRLGKTKTIESKRVASLLYPIAAFLHAGGVTKEEALRTFGSMFTTVSTVRIGRKMEHIGHPTHYADIIAMWVRSNRYLDAKGWPRSLRLAGPSGFSSLVKSASPQTDPKKVLSVLMRYGNVRRNRVGAYELVRPYFYTSGPKAMAYEPVAYFLSDASATLGKILRRTKQWRGPDLFWQKTENKWISEASAKDFNVFAKERSLVFLEELDDWLEAHSVRNRDRTRQRRVGLGIFSIYSDHER